MTVIQEVEQLERQRFAAQITKDYAVLEKIFADDLVYTHANGHQDSKASYLESIRAGQSRYDRVDVEALSIRSYNDERTALVNGTVRIDLGPGPDGQALTTHIKYAVVYIKNPVGWQLVLWHAQKQAA